MENNTSLSARQKSEIYWKKRVYYFDAAEIRGGMQEDYLNRDAAEDTLFSYENGVFTKGEIIPTGKEFLPCSPSAAGRRFFADSVAKLMHFSDYLGELLNSSEETPAILKEVFTDGIGPVKDLIDSTLYDFFTACGFDKKGRSVDNKSLIKEKKKGFKKTAKIFEEKISGYYYDYGSQILKNIRIECNIPERVSVDIDPKDEEFEELIRKYSEGGISDGETFDKIRKDILVLRQEMAERMASKALMRDELVKRYKSGNPDPIRKAVVMQVSFSQRDVIDNKVKELENRREEQLKLVKKLLMKNEDEKASSGEIENDEFLFELLGREQIEEYKGRISRDHYRKIKKGEFNAIYVYDIAGGKKEPFGAVLTTVHNKWLELVWMRIFNEDAPADKKGRFIYYSLLNDKKRRNTDLIGAFLEIPTEEAWEDASDAIALSGMECETSPDNIYEFKLSDFTYSKTYAAAAKKMSCISLSEAEPAMLMMLDELMHKDERVVPVPALVDWESYSQDLSFICISDDEPKGTILVSEKEDHLIVSLFYSRDPMALASLLHYSFKRAAERFGRDKKVLVPVVVNRSEALVKRLVSDAQRGTVLNGVMRFK